MKKRYATLAVWLCLSLLPALALACPVCFNAREETRKAFFWTMVLLTVLPLGLIGGTLWWLWRRVKAGAALTSASDPSHTPPAR